MPRNFETKYFEESFATSSSQGLRSYFGRVREGQSEVFETPFAKGESTENLLSAWKSILESISSRWPSLWDYEIDLANKVGPMSIMKPLKDRMIDIDSYYEGILLPSTPINRRAVKAVISEWSQARGLRIRNQANTLAKMKVSTNSGSPYFTKRRYVVDKTMPCSVKVNDREVLQSLKAGDFKACAVLGWRGQEGGLDADDVKQRVVWMFPFAVNIAELQLYQPLIEAAQSFNLVPAWVSMESVDRSITHLFDSKSSDDLVVCTDFSKFDQHFNASLQNCAKEVISAILTSGTESNDWIEEVFPIKYMMPLAYDWGKVRFGSHGMGSGSGGTNADETLTHRALQYESAILSGVRLNPYSQCLGDDGILSYPSITVDKVVEHYSSHGLEMNQDKQYASRNDCTYLRRWHHKDYRVGGICVGVYSTCRALGRLRYLERYVDPELWGPKAVALRQLSILENVKYHPLKEQFVQFCMKRDKYRLGLDIPDFLDNITNVASEFMSLMPDFLGYTRTNMEAYGTPGSGIQNWWIVEYLKSQR